MFPCESSFTDAEQATSDTVTSLDRREPPWLVGNPFAEVSVSGLRRSKTAMNRGRAKPLRLMSHSSRRLIRAPAVPAVMGGSVRFRLNGKDSNLTLISSMSSVVSIASTVPGHRRSLSPNGYTTDHRPVTSDHEHEKQAVRPRFPAH